MFPPFPQESAHHYCTQIISLIEDGVVKLKDVARPSQERAGQGVMIGVLVCNCPKESDGDFVKRKILVTLSGRRYRLERLPDNFTYLLPIISDEQVDKALKENDAEIHKLTYQINSSTDSNSKEILKEKRKQLTDKSLRNVFSLYDFYCSSGKKISLNSIIAKKNSLPQTGTGDCCAPNLLSYAMEHNLQPFSMDEVYFGPDTSSKIKYKSYTPCDERCRFILPDIMGLEILYRDSQIVVVNKQAGLLSVPGIGEEKADCVESRFKRLFPDCEVAQPAVHRLDMETSGIIILARTKTAHSFLYNEFREGRVHKTYSALLDGVLEKAEGNCAPKNGQTDGCITLKTRLDVDNRPYQIYDEENGKTGITEWKKTGSQIYENSQTGEKKRVTKVEFYPQTGRTHQLRLASALPQGFGLPIIGDSLYGKCEKGQRLMLHAKKITFRHPVSLNYITIECPEEW